MPEPTFLDLLLQDPATAGMAVMAAVTALVVIRIVRLGIVAAEASFGAAEGGPTTSPAPASRRWFPSRKERLHAEAELVRSETDLLLARLDNARATGGLVQQRLELERIIAAATPPPSTRCRGRSPTSLTISEIAQVLHAMPEVSPDLRETVCRVLAARVGEQHGGEP